MTWDPLPLFATLGKTYISLIEQTTPACPRPVVVHILQLRSTAFPEKGESKSRISFLSSPFAFCSLRPPVTKFPLLRRSSKTQAQERLRKTPRLIDLDWPTWVTQSSWTEFLKRAGFPFSFLFLPLFLNPSLKDRVETCIQNEERLTKVLPPTQP